MRRSEILIGGKTTKEKLEEYKTWDAEKLANNLVQARKECVKERMRAERYFKEIHSEGIAGTLRDQNKILKRLLEESGIKPTKLRVEYTASDCKNCTQYNEQDDTCENYDIWWDECPVKKCVISECFYTYDVDDGVLKGINARLKAKEYDVISVIDEDMKEVVWRK